MLFIITFIGLMAAIYSIPYIGHEYEEKELDGGPGQDITTSSSTSSCSPC